MQIQTQKLIKKYEQYADKYFSRAKEILQKENINPFVKYQIFAREKYLSAYCSYFFINFCVCICILPP
jgi:hypothetical protein